jgi:hypothetical protein
MLVPQATANRAMLTPISTQALMDSAWIHVPTDTGVTQSIGPVNHVTIQLAALLKRLVLPALEHLPRAVLLVQLVHTSSLSITPVFRHVRMDSMSMEICVRGVTRIILQVILMEPVSLVLDRILTSAGVVAVFSIWILQQENVWILVQSAGMLIP